MQVKTDIIPNMCGGKGEVIINHILGEKELNGKCGLYAEVILKPGCTLGYHEHHGESDTYSQARVTTTTTEPSVPSRPATSPLPPTERATVSTTPATAT